MFTRGSTINQSEPLKLNHIIHPLLWLGYCCQTQSHLNLGLPGFLTWQWKCNKHKLLNFTHLPDTTLVHLMANLYSCFLDGFLSSFLFNFLTSFVIWLCLGIILIILLCQSGSIGPACLHKPFVSDCFFELAKKGRFGTLRTPLPFGELLEFYLVFSSAVWPALILHPAHQHI